MKRKRLICLISSLLFLSILCACGAQFDPQLVVDHYADRAFSAQYTVTTHAGFYTEYQLSCLCQDGISSVTILQPESVAGICAVMQNGDIKLQYEEVSLEALLPEIAGFAPMDVLHGVLNDLQAAVPGNYTLEGERLTLQYQETLRNGTETLKVVTLHPETLDLQAAECYLDGSLILSLQMEELEWIA